MIIGTIKEVKDNENRVGLTPLSVIALKHAGHQVFVEAGAGVNAGFPDADYKKAGAKLVSKKEVFQCADILIKVKELIQQEYPLIPFLKNKILFTYLHLAAVDPQLTQLLVQHKVTAIAYETVEKGEELPLLKPMSEVAGVLAVQYGAQYLQKKYHGRGITLGTIAHTTPAEVVVLGGGTVGYTASRTALGLGCNVTIIQRRTSKRKEIKAQLVKDLGFLAQHATLPDSTPKLIAHATQKADLIVGAVLVRGAKAPQLVSQSMVKAMKQGTVIVDVAIDQGGCIWGSKATSHSDPIYEKEGKVYCCIPNMPGQAALQSTEALTYATLPYLLKLAKGGVSALKHDPGFLKGLNTYQGKITYEAVAKDLGLMQYYTSRPSL